MKIALITDAWLPQVNGVVRTWSTVIEQSGQWGCQWLVIHPELFKTIQAPKYPEIQLALRPGPTMARLLDDFNPQAVHIATEGPLGLAGRRLCLKRRWRFTTSYHTQFPLYLKQYFKIPRRLSYAYLRWFHRPSAAVLVPTASMTRELEQHGMRHLVTWTRGVDTTRFHPIADAAIPGLPEGKDRPIFLYAGRVAHEKNIEAFLSLDLPGCKAVVGDGPAKASLEAKYPDVYFAGYQFGDDLTRHYAAADVFVFPSKTDTFGVVLLEAGACGLPCAAYPVTGPIDVVKPGVSGALNDDLRTACLEALKIPRASAIAYASQFTWERCARQATALMTPGIHAATGDKAQA